MTPDRIVERFNICLGMAVGWQLATVVLWVWARLPGSIVGIMFELSMVPVAVGLWSYLWMVVQAFRANRR